MIADMSDCWICSHRGEPAGLLDGNPICSECRAELRKLALESHVIDLRGRDESDGA